MAKGKKNKDKKNKEKKKISKKAIISAVISIIALIAAVLASISIISLTIVPNSILVPVLLILAVFTVIGIILSFTKFTAGGRIISVLLTLAYAAAFIVSGRVSSAVEARTGMQKQQTTFSVLVLMEDDADDMSKTYSYFYGYNASADKDLTDKAIIEITKDANLRPALKKYDTLNDAVCALYEQKIQVLIFNEAQRELMKTIYPDFDQDTKILKSYEFETDIEAFPKAGEDYFTLYISAASDEDDSPAERRETVVLVNMSEKKLTIMQLPYNCRINIKTDADVGAESLSNLAYCDINYVPDTLKDLLGTDINYYLKINDYSVTDSIKLTELMFNSEAEIETNIPAKTMQMLLREEIFLSKKWQYEYCVYEWTDENITGEIYGIHNMTVSVMGDMIN